MSDSNAVASAMFTMIDALDDIADLLPDYTLAFIAYLPGADKYDIVFTNGQLADLQEVLRRREAAAAQPAPATSMLLQ